MLLDRDDLGRGVMDVIASDVQLLEASVNDLVTALGGIPSSARERCFERLKSARLIETFSRTARNERTYGYYRQFKGLDVQVDSFFRILKLHLDRGFAYLARASLTESSIKLFCLCYVDPVFDLYYGVLKQLVTFTLHDCVYLYKFFLKIENSLLAYRIKHVYIRDEIYDLILHSLWFALKDAWWLYLNPRLLKPLFPFIAHMRVDGNYDVTSHDLNHVLHNINFVTLISQDISFQSETATLVESGSPNGELAEPGKHSQDPPNNYDNMSESDLEIKYVRDVSTFGVTDTVENEQMEGVDEVKLEPHKESKALTNGDFEGIADFAKHLSDYEASEDREREVSWSQVMYVALVGCTYIVLFESYLNAVTEALNLRMAPSSYVELLARRLQDLIQVNALLFEVDCNFTAWAHDKLGDNSDAHLSTCFNKYSDLMFSGDRGREVSFLAHSADFIGTLGDLGRGVSMYLLSPTLARLQKLQQEIVLKLSLVCTTPVLRAIERIYFLEDSKLYYDVLYNTDEYLIGPGGALARGCRLLPLPFKRAVFVGTFFKIVRAYVLKVVESATEVCEAVFFDVLAIWDSVADFFDFPVNPHLVGEECVRLVGTLLDQVKFTTRISLSELDAFSDSLKLDFFACHTRPESSLSLYTYECLACASPGIYPSSLASSAESDPAPAHPESAVLDKYVVWLDGVRKKRMLIFGNLVLFFRDNSLLQPVGFIAFSSIYSILAPHTFAQVHPNVQILENNSENDSFSCGTSQSSASSTSHDAVDVNPLDENMDFTGPIKAYRFPNPPASDHFNLPICEPSPALQLSKPDPGNPGLVQYRAAVGGIYGLERIGNNSIPDVAAVNASLNRHNVVRGSSARGNVTTKTRLSTRSSRRSSVVDNMFVWGWQIRLDLFEACILDDFNYFDFFVDLEFTSPEHRNFWEKQIRNRASARSQVISWPYHSFFFDSI